MMDSDTVKLLGNDAFKRGDYAEAEKQYSMALSMADTDSAKIVLLCNRAACHIKSSEWSKCIEDCSTALRLNPLTVKALFRRSQAYNATKEYGKAVTDLDHLLRVDSGNSDAITLMRKVKPLLLQEQSDRSQVKVILEAVRKDGSQLMNGIKSLIGLTYDDRNHAMDFARKGGLPWIADIINTHLAAGFAVVSAEHDVLLAAIRLLSSCSTHVDFVNKFVHVSRSGETDSTHVSGTSCPKASIELTAAGQLRFASLCSLLTVRDSSLAQVSLVLVMSVLKSVPASAEMGVGAKRKSGAAGSSSNSEDDGACLKAVDAEITFSLDKATVVAVLRAFHAALQNRLEDVYSVLTDSLSAFLSESADYFERSKEVDTRLENLGERKLRLREQRILKTRSRNHSMWAVECGLLDLLVDHLDCDSPTVRQNAGNCLGKLIHHLDDEAAAKAKLAPHLRGHEDPEHAAHDEDKRVVELPDDLAPPSVLQCRRRAALEAVLLMSLPELGSWALALPGGVPQLLLLVATGDPRCQELAAEVMCLAASSDASSGQLSRIVSSGVLTTLMHSPYHGTRAAAASTVTKLSLKAKALSEDSAEVAQILNTVLGVLKTANNPDSGADAASAVDGQLVSFSALDEVGSSQAQAKTKSQSRTKAKAKSSSSGGVDAQVSNAVTMTSVERAVEVLAAMIGKTYVKEEVVHGSYRVAACVSELAKLDLDVRSTAAYGLTHILAALTVTNGELHARALAEKDITPEQFQQMQELQRIKTKDEAGNVIEEKKDESDPDTPELCRRRIQRLVACDVIPVLVRYLADGSSQTKEAAARTLRQICVDESSRGLMLQQGGFKACCSAAVDEAVPKAARLECGHAVAKSLVTSNPHLLTEHMRLGAVKPLVMLCRESDATNLQQFEGLLALTNVLSCGEREQDKLVAEKGVSAVHYLVFSDNVMVRRAAMEALCNMNTHESVLKMLRSGDKLKLWLGLAEDWDNDKADAHEAFLIARAAAGTLAGAACDPEVADAMVSCDCARTVVTLLESGNPELIHRALVVVLQLLSTEKRAVAEHLMHGSVVPAMGGVTKLKEPMLADLAMQCAQALSELMKSAPESISDRVTQLDLEES